jgi:hypothetical protein
MVVAPWQRLLLMLNLKAHDANCKRAVEALGAVA